MLDHILAKSDGETLVQHTQEVLAKLAALRALRPSLLTQEQWKCLYWACFLHDWGKVARGFQTMLRGGERWHHRHEVLSLVFIDWIAPAFSEEEQLAIVAAIVSHHKDASEIQRKYPAIDISALEALVSELDEPTGSALWYWLHESADGAIRAKMLGHDEAIELVMTQGAKNIHFWLRKYERYVRDLRNSSDGLSIFLRGLTTTSDHMASAHVRKLLGSVLFQPLSAPYVHQVASAHRTGNSALLVSPTGSGKTEAALAWAGDGKSKIFYALPYQASMNAMYTRLQGNFGKSSVGLQHGKAVQALYTRLVNQEVSRPSPAARAKWEKNITLLHARPVTVFSPYQMLKSMFRLKGYEASLTDYAQASFIFDEIHAYEPARLALILSMIEYLRKNFGARFFVMSATFPSLIRSKLMKALDLDEADIITAGQSTFEQFRRHRLSLEDGGLLEDSIERIVEEVWSGKSVLACANTVRRAQAVRQALLSSGLTEKQVRLIHSRYIVQDRIAREQEILKRCASNTGGFVLVATQVVEVSLNIDLDTIYSDPAPLEALLQRFGRVNRTGKKGIVPVHVFRQPSDGQRVYLKRLVQKTLEELERHNGEEIDESQINAWLDTIYSDETIMQRWTEKYEQVEQSARLILANLRAFESDEMLEDEFDRLFDAVEVLPICFEKEYVQCLMDNDYLEASQYLVSISKHKYWQLAKKGLVLPVEQGNGKRYMVRLSYDSNEGLLFDEREQDDFD